MSGLPEFGVLLPGFLIVSVKCESNSIRFQPGEGPSGVLLREGEIFANIRLKLYSIKSNPPHS